MISVEERLTFLENQVKQMQAVNFSLDYEVAWTCLTGAAPAIGNGTLLGRYTLRGRMCLVNIQLVAGASTTFGGGTWAFSLPFPAKNGSHSYYGVAHLRDAATNNYERIAQIAAGASVISAFIQPDSGTNVSVLDAATPWAWGTADGLYLQIEYETNR